MSKTGPWRVTQDSGASGKGSDLFVYLVDIATGWIMAGAFQANDMEEARMQAMQEGWDQQVWQTLVRIVRHAATTGLDDTNPSVREAIGLGMACATISQTFKTVLEDRGAVEGHWVVMVYTAKSGAAKVQFSFGDSRREDFLGEADMAIVLRESMTAHLDLGCEFGALMASEGGAVVAPSFQGLMRRP